ncbi:uncharacterized protein LOC100901804 [Galendromus occidentalis]|uniref:Uncharacterized protein LOC100901804 n=1 Tax=Galendromus occidentalis TaxID=34638 RepID=A0AAJ6QMT2_9ACAR|nr:uncharacterized protein LOC100901804 [Galendromus occidentalis]
MKMRLSEVQDELSQKQDEIVKLRTEASNQIRNIELYWQERLTKEMKELCYIKEQEVESLRDEFNKQVKQLTDKINSLQTIMKLTGQDQPVAVPIVEEPSTSEEQDPEDVEEDTDDDVESIEEIDGGQSDEEFEEIIEEIIELSPCAQRAAALKHNPLVKSPSASLEAGASRTTFPGSLLKKSSSSGDCRPSSKGKRVSFAEDRGDLPMLLRYNPDVSCMDILRPLEEQFMSKKKRSSIIRQSVKRSQTKDEPRDSQQTQF